MNAGTGQEGQLFFRRYEPDQFVRFASSPEFLRVSCISAHQHTRSRREYRPSSVVVLWSSEQSLEENHHKEDDGGDGRPPRITSPSRL